MARTSGHWFQVSCLYEHGAVTPTGLREQDLVHVQQWCVENHCGTRMSFDQWRFDNESQVTAFLLRWGS